MPPFFSRADSLPWTLFFPAHTHTDPQLSGSGGMIFFHIGVGSALYDMGLTNGQFAGISGGAITSTVLAAGNSPQAILDFLAGGVTTLEDLKAACQAHPVICGLLALPICLEYPGLCEAPPKAAQSCDGAPLIPFLKLVLNSPSVLPVGTTNYVNTRDNLHIFSSMLNKSADGIEPNVYPAFYDLSRPFGAASPGYLNRADIINSAAMSAWVPCGVANATYGRHRGYPWMDGGASTPVSALCDAMGATALGQGKPCLQVLAVALGPKGNQSQPFSSNNSTAHSGGDSPLYATVAPNEVTTLPESCSAYFDKNGRCAGKDFWPVYPTLPAGDISNFTCPGCRVPTPYTATDLQIMAAFNLSGTSTGDNFTTTVTNLINLGVAEAVAWAQENGLV